MLGFQIQRNDIQIFRNEIQAGWNKFQIRRNEIQIQNPSISFAKSSFFNDLRRPYCISVFLHFHFLSRFRPWGAAGT